MASSSGKVFVEADTAFVPQFGQKKASGGSGLPQCMQNMAFFLYLRRRTYGCRISDRALKMDDPTLQRSPIPMEIQQKSWALSALFFAAS